MTLMRLITIKYFNRLTALIYTYSIFKKKIENKQQKRTKEKKQKNEKKKKTTKTNKQTKKTKRKNKKEMKKTIPFTIASKRIKYLGII